MSPLIVVAEHIVQAPHLSSGADRGLSVPRPTPLCHDEPRDSGADTKVVLKIVGRSSLEMFLRYRPIQAETLGAARQVPAIAAL